MPTREILQFAGGGGANVLSQVAYAALASILSDGYPAGILDSNLLNKTLRQSNFIAVGVAEYLVQQGINVPDDADVAVLAANIEASIRALAVEEIDAAFVGANQSLATNGYQILPGGLILQWGTTGQIVSGGNVVVTFPIAFPTAPLGAVCSFFAAGNLTLNHTMANNVGSGATATQMNIYYYSGSTDQPAHWFCIGH